MLQKWLGEKDLGKFSIDIIKLADGLRSYAIAINGFSGLVKQEDLDIASTIAASLAALNTSLPYTGGTLQKWLGEKDLGKFSIDIIKLALGLKSYAIATNGFSGLAKQVDLDIASTTAASLAALNSSLPYTGGTLQKWLGEKDLGSFSDNIVLLANGLIQYATKISGFAGLAKPEDFASAVDVATNLASLNSTLPSTGGTLQKWLGEKDLGSFTTNVGLLGDGLKTFADSIGGVSYEKSEEALGVIDIISKFNEGMTETGGLWSSIRGWFSGEKDMVGLSEKMANVGTNLNTFATKLSTADFSNTESATKLMTDMQTFIGSLETTGGLWANIGEWFGGKKDVVELSGKMATFGKNFGIFSVGITGAQQASTDFNYVNSVITAFGTLADAVKNGEIDTAAIGEVATTIGKSFVTSVKGAIEGGASDIGTAATTLSGAGSTAAEGTYHTWYSSGQYLASGLADGIAAMASHVNNAAANVAAGATRAIQNTWIIHSPSRVGHNLGMNFDLGVAGGLIKYAKVVSDEAANVGASAVESARTMLRGVDGSIFDNLDPNPTIRPVMDLTNIQNGVSAISGMFNPSNMQTIGLFRGMKLSKGISQLNLDGGRITGTFTDKNIISTLEGLQTKIEELGNAVTNMKLILDTGALVGGTSAKMDNELGMLAMRKGRGN